MMKLWSSARVVRLLLILGRRQVRKSYQPNCCSQVSLTARLNTRGGVKMVTYLPEKVKQVGRTLTKPVFDLPLNGLGLQVEVEQQLTTSALPATNFVPIIFDLVLFSMQIN